jgi:hypothetical protein
MSATSYLGPMLFAVLRLLASGLYVALEAGRSANDARPRWPAGASSEAKEVPECLCTGIGRRSDGETF